MRSAILRDYAAVLPAPLVGSVGLLLLELDKAFSSFWVVIPELLKFISQLADSGQLRSCLWLSDFSHKRSRRTSTSGVVLAVRQAWSKPGIR